MTNKSDSISGDIAVEEILYSQVFSRSCKYSNSLRLHHLATTNLLYWDQTTPLQLAEIPCCLIATGAFAEKAALITSWSIFYCRLFIRQNQMHSVDMESHFDMPWKQITSPTVNVFINQQLQTRERCNSLIVYNTNISNIISNIHYTDPEVETAVLH